MWKCQACTFDENHQRFNRCKICRTKKIEDLSARGGETSFKVKREKDWPCPQCTLINESHKTKCSLCFFDIGKPSYQERLGKSYRSPDNEFDTGNETRIVLIGRTGSGKSATGNSLLGTYSFESLVSGSSVTSKCKRGEQWREDKKVIVVDTPGLFDTGMTNEKVTKEIVKCIGMTSPGPHAMVLVVGIGRFTKEEQDTVQHFVDHFGEGMLQYMIVLFTRKDELSKRNQSIHQYVNSVPNELKTLLHRCGNRYIAFNNDATGQEMESQVREFYDMVNKVVFDNGGSCYTSELYQEAEETMQRRMREQKRKLEMEKEREKAHIERQIQGKYEKRLTEEILQKSRLEEDLNQKQREQRQAREEKKQLKDTIQNLNEKLREQNRYKSDENRQERKQMEVQIRQLREQLSQVERRNTEKETERLQMAYRDAEKRHERQISEMRKEIRELSSRKDREYDQKMSAEKLRQNERNDVETEKNGIVDDLWNGCKKIGSGLLKAGKKVLGFFGF